MLDFSPDISSSTSIMLDDVIRMLDFSPEISSTSIIISKQSQYYCPSKIFQVD